jgi:hypothetical protein
MNTSVQDETAKKKNVKKEILKIVFFFVGFWSWLADKLSFHP